MFTTQTIWPQNNGQNPTNQEISALASMAATLSPDNPDNLNSALNNDGTLVIAYRSWPTQEIAQQWIDYMIANYNINSCTIYTE